MEKRLKLVGTYNSFSNTYNKARVYFNLAGDASGVIEDIYNLSMRVCQMSINDSDEIRAELAEIAIKSGKVSLTLEVHTDAQSIKSIANNAFDRTVILGIRYEDEKSLERVSNSFYAKIVKTMDRMSKAMGMATVGELTEAVNQAYGNSVLIHANMYLADAQQLWDVLAKYADAALPDFDMNIGSGPDSYVTKRMQAGKCALCDKAMVSIIDGIPLCEPHKDERGATTRDKFMARHHLGDS